MFDALWMSFVIAFFINVVYIALKAFQQLNVMHHKYLWVMPISLSMAACEVITTKLIVANGGFVFIPIGIGGGLGCMASMYLHKLLRERSTRCPSDPAQLP